MTYANVTDVSTRLGRPINSPDEIAQVNAWLGDVERLILRRLPNLDDYITDGTVDADDVVRVEAQAVIRKILNPEGKVAEDIDDYRYRYNENTRRGELFLTDEEWAAITPVAASGAFSTRPGFEPDRGPWGWP